LEIFKGLVKLEEKMRKVLK